MTSLGAKVVRPCSHCSLHKGIIRKGRLWTLVLNSNQATLGRLFFTLNRHETDVSALSTVETETLWNGIREARRTLDTLFAADHYNYMFLMNVDPHVHMHIFPRYSSSREFDSVQFTDPTFGGHYDPQASVSLSADTESKLIESIQTELFAAGECQF